MPQPFDESVVLITGATSGIGLAAARAFAAKGCKLALSGRRKELGEDAATEIREQGGDAIFVQADVDDVQQLKDLVGQTVVWLGAPENSFTTGITVPVDGGFTAQ